MTRHIAVQPGEIVVVVPRWIIITVGLLMLMVELSVAFFVLFAGLVPEGVILSLFVLVLVPIQLLIMYIVWRFYWFVLILGFLLQSLLGLTAIISASRLVGSGYGSLFGMTARTNTNVGQSLTLVVLMAVSLSALVTLLIGVIIFTVTKPNAPAVAYDPYDLDKPARPKPRRRSEHRDLWQDDSPPKRFPPPDDPYWDDK